MHADALDENGEGREAESMTVGSAERPAAERSTEARQHGAPSAFKIPSGSSRPSVQTAGAKRPRSVFDAGAKNRVFGMLNQTLKKFKTDNESKDDKAKRRAAVDARVKPAPRQYIHAPAPPTKLALQVQRLNSELPRDRLAISAMINQIAGEEAEHRTLRAQKRRLASFLVTSTAPGPMGNRYGVSRPVAPYIPGSIAPTSRRTVPVDLTSATYPVYFLPFKLLPSQDDKLDDQEERCDEEIDALDDSWDTRRKSLVKALAELKKQLSTKEAELKECTRLKAEEDAARAQREKEREERERQAEHQTDKVETEADQKMDTGIEPDDDGKTDKDKAVATEDQVVRGDGDTAIASDGAQGSDQSLAVVDELKAQEATRTQEDTIATSQ